MDKIGNKIEGKRKIPYYEAYNTNVEGEKMNKYQ